MKEIREKFSPEGFAGILLREFRSYGLDDFPEAQSHPPFPISHVTTNDTMFPKKYTG